MNNQTILGGLHKRDREGHFGRLSLDGVLNNERLEFLIASLMSERCFPRTSRDVTHDIKHDSGPLLAREPESVL
jgi:hypothetical protein